MSLNGAEIVITRPVEQAERVGAMIARAGGKVILFPALEIAEVADLHTINALIDRLDEFGYAIFISQNAARIGFKRIRARRTLPRDLQIAAIGEATRDSLTARGVAHVIAPNQGFDSEALLAMPELENVRGKRIAIFRGVGGRETLRAELEARGAVVEYAECYERRRPAIDVQPLAERLARGKIQGLSAMSRETLENFCAMIDPAANARIRQTTLFVPHPAIAEAARQLGFGDIRVTGPGDDSLLHALEERFCRAK
jgi:uroporphyrinogen-III synthase